MGDNRDNSSDSRYDLTGYSVRHSCDVATDFFTKTGIECSSWSGDV